MKVTKEQKRILLWGLTEGFQAMWPDGPSKEAQAIVLPMLPTILDITYQGGDLTQSQLAQTIKQVFDAETEED